MADHRDITEQIIQDLLATREGVEKLAVSMREPLRMRIDYAQMFGKVLVYGETNSVVSSGSCRSRIAWTDLMHPKEGRRHSLLERSMEMAKTALASGLDDHLFTHLQKSAPTPGHERKFSEDALREAAAKLSAEDEIGQVCRPRILMNALTYATHRKAGMFRYTECQRTTMTLGFISAFEGCDILVTRRLEPGPLVVVSRRPSQVRGMLEVRADLVTYAPPEPGELGGDGRIGGSLEFEFEAKMPVGEVWPESVWLQCS